MRIHVIDAFTDRPFAGNPAGVCLLETQSWPDAGWMQALAAEMNHPETAFARPLPGGGEADWGLRWFTPTVEVDLCGHATLATTHALRTTGQLDGRVRFASRSGVLVASCDGDDITLDFPAAGTLTEATIPGLSGALGCPPVETYRVPERRNILAVLPDEESVRGLRPDLAAVLELSGEHDVHGVICTSLAASKGPADFVSRFFAPAAGIPEDPVTGGAHTVLSPFWSARLGRAELTGRQLSARGGTVRTRLLGDRVLLTGRAVTVLEGQLGETVMPG